MRYNVVTIQDETMVYVPVEAKSVYEIDLIIRDVMDNTHSPKV